MTTTLKWQKTIIDRVAKMSTRELFEAFADLSTDFDNGREQWERDYIRKQLTTRVDAWLKVVQTANDFESKYLSKEYCPVCHTKNFLHTTTCAAFRLSESLQEVRFRETRIR